MAPYKALYGCQCRSPFYWDNLGEHKVIVPDLVEEVEAKVRIARQRLLAAQSRQKSYAEHTGATWNSKLGSMCCSRFLRQKG